MKPFTAAVVQTASVAFEPARTRGKFDFDAAGHYARPYVFRLMVDETSKAAVQVNTPAVIGLGS